MQNNIYSVTQVNNYIKNMFVTDNFLSNVSVKGEVGNCTYHASGHIYFSIKDDKGVLSCVMFAGKRSGLKVRMVVGMEVVVHGSISMYERDGKVQIYADSIEEAGKGDLYKEFLELKNRLEEQGMFDASYKQPIPKFVKKLGVVTAPTGAAVRDIIDVSKRRNPGIEIILYPALVQGDCAWESIVEGINTLDKYGVDVIIVGRGGGSMEDLWCFNDERVANAVFNACTPIISAVGHETDTTIIDYVADLRAPTPSAAAELAVCDISKLIERLTAYEKRLLYSVENRISFQRRLISNYRNQIKYLSPEYKLNGNRLRLAACEDKLNMLINSKLIYNRHILELKSGHLNGLSPLTRLSGGFSFVENSSGKPVLDCDDVQENEIINVHMKSGTITARVIGKSDGL